jgi:hypothetical protein
MKKFFQGLGLLVAVLGIAVFAAGDLLKERMYAKLTEDMFVSEDADAFSPGVAVGELFPDLNVSYQGQTVSDMGQFIGDKGMIFIAVRSVDW